uniref:Spry1 protein n=1 Tax=Mus musculus TaxID=10090 RepID=Q8CHU2_MOUSE|nr:Spry1 protein [Mus musculus]
MDSPSQHGSHTSLVVIQPPAVEGRQRLDYDRDTQPATILSLDQIKAIRGSNEYTEGPSVARRPAPRTAPRPEKQERTHEIIPANVNSSYEHRPASHPGNARGSVLSRSTSTGSAASSGSSSSVSSEQGLLGRSPPTRPCPPVWPVIGSASAPRRAWWNTGPACAWSRAFSTTAPMMMMEVLTRITHAPVHSPTAAPDTCAWEPCLCAYPACSATLPPRAA